MRRGHTACSPDPFHLFLLRAAPSDSAVPTPSFCSYLELHRVTLLFPPLPSASTSSCTERLGCPHPYHLRRLRAVSSPNLLLHRLNMRIINI